MWKKYSRKGSRDGQENSVFLEPIKEGLSGKTAFERRPKRMRGCTMWVFGRRMLQVKGTAGRKDFSWDV